MFAFVSRFRVSPEQAALAEARLAALRRPPPPVAVPPPMLVQRVGQAVAGVGWLPNDDLFDRLRTPGDPPAAVPLPSEGGSPAGKPLPSGGFRPRVPGAGGLPWPGASGVASPLPDDSWVGVLPPPRSAGGSPSVGSAVGAPVVAESGGGSAVSLDSWVGVLPPPRSAGGSPSVGSAVGAPVVAESGGGSAVSSDAWASRTTHPVGRAGGRHALRTEAPDARGTVAGLAGRGSADAVGAGSAGPSEVGDESPASAGRASEALVGPLPVGRLRSRLAGLVPESLAGARIDPGRRGAVSIVALGLAAAAVVGVLTWRSRPAPVPVTAPAAVRSGGLLETDPAGPASSTTQAPLVVAVAGKVRRPGIVSLPPGARVIDALRAAGGALPGVDLGLLNLARRLSDGELVVVGLPAGPDPAAAPAQPSSGPAGAAGAPLDLNAATAEQLDALPGVGPVLAQRIVEFRAAHGRFTSVDQLRDVSGIGDSKFAQLRDRVTV